MEFIIFSLDVKNIITYKRRYSAGLEIEVLKRRIYLRAGASYQKVLTISGKNVTPNFIRGAKEVLKIIKEK